MDNPINNLVDHVTANQAVCDRAILGAYSAKLQGLEEKHSFVASDRNPINDTLDIGLKVKAGCVYVYATEREREALSPVTDTIFGALVMGAFMRMRGHWPQESL